MVHEDKGVLQDPHKDVLPKGDIIGIVTGPWTQPLKLMVRVIYINTDTCNTDPV
jgi:hypothetical protein